MEHGNRNRKANARELAEGLEARYHNGELRDNLTDALSDLLHNGLQLETLDGCVRSARSHYEAEQVEPWTPTLFRRWPKSEGGDVFALFPLIPETKLGECASYARVGQHSAADLYGCIARTRPASLDDEDVQALKRELESIGYRVRPIKRTPHWSKVTASRREAGL